MSTYAVNAALNNGHLTQTEVHLYGSSRLGIYNRNVDVQNFVLNTTGIYTFERGNKFFELSNHLGNILVTVSDRKLQVQSQMHPELVEGYVADVISANDYAPFGMTQPGRKYQSGASTYRYGFNGKENDNEVKGEGNQQDYGMRIYDPRLGRFLSVDPFEDEYPWNSPYSFAEDDPINYVDLDGAEKSKSEFQQIDKDNLPRLKIITADPSLLSIATKGAFDAILNANTVGISDLLPDWLGSTANLDDYSTDVEKEAYLRGRIAGDALAGVQSFIETNSGLATAAAGGTAAVATSETGIGLLVSGGVAVAGLIEAGHGLGVGVTATYDVGWAFRKLYQLNIQGTAVTNATSSTNQQAQSAHQKNTEASATNAAGTKSKQTELANTGSSSKSLVKQKKLPTEGKIRFVPSRASVMNKEIPKKNGGYIDKFGNIWKKGPSRTKGEAFEWDVQLSRRGKKMIGWLSNAEKKSHVNVSQKGKVTH